MNTIAFIITNQHSNERGLFSFTPGKDSKSISFIKLLDESESVSYQDPLYNPTVVIFNQKTSTIIDLNHIDSKSTPINLPAWNTNNLDSIGNTWYIKEAWLRVLEKSDGGVLYYLFLTSKDGAVACVLITSADNSMSIKWKREEALAHVLQSEFIDFPADKSMLDELTDEFSTTAMFTRVITHFRIFITHLVESIGGVFKFPLEGNLWQSLVAFLNNAEEPANNLRDRFGFNKLIVSITKSGKIFGIHSRTGEIQWTRYYPQQEFKYMFTVKKPHTSDSELILFGVNSKSEWWVSTLNPLTGSQISYSSLPYSIIYAMSVPFHDIHYRLTLALDTEHNVHLFPETDTIKDFVFSHKERIHFYLHNSKQDTLTGYGIGGSDKNHITAIPLWSKVWGGTSEKVIYVSDANKIKMNAHSPAIVLGDNSVLWKYLNPNIAIIATSSSGSTAYNTDDSESSDEISINDSENYVITIYIIDVTSGNILYRVEHRHATTPLHIAHAENWIVAYFWNTKSHCYELSTLDLFRKTSNWEGQGYTSYSEGSVNIEVKKNSYLFPYSLNTIATTITHQGITNKKLLLGLHSGNIMQLDKRFVDGRRSVRPNNQPIMEDQLEGLLPYLPLIDVNALNYINYNRTIPLLRDIYVGPTQLESSSLVICHGLDVFFTVLGSNSYDSLDPNFNRAIIILALAVLSVITLSMRLLSKRNILKVNWK